MALWLAAGFAHQAAGDVVLTEFMAVNNRALEDEDGDHPDWIELHNYGTTAVNLDGWHLTDDPARLTRWRFPATNLPPETQIVVFASNKNRRTPGRPLHTNFRLSSSGGYLALTRPDGRSVASSFGPGYPPQVADISFGTPMRQARVPLVTGQSTLRLHVPGDNLLESVWTQPGTDDSSWIIATNGIGFGITGSPGVPIQSAVAGIMHGRNASAWLRYPFMIDDSVRPRRLLLRMRYDDGFIAWLNGVEVARANAPDAPAWNAQATRPGTAGTAFEGVEWDLTSRIGLLQPGANLLAIQGLNLSADDDDFLALPELEATTATLDTARQLYFQPASPGSENGPGTTNLGPLVFQVSHQPAQPASSNTVTINARVQATFRPVASVTLAWRVMFGAEVSVPMADDGLHGDGAPNDGVFGALIPFGSGLPGQMLRWNVKAIDSGGATTRWPPFPNRRNSPEYDGTVYANPSLTNPLPVLHWFVQSLDIGDDEHGDRPDRSSIYFKGQFHDNVSASLHGQTTRDFPKKSFNFEMNPGDRFVFDPDQQAVHSFNLLSTFSDKAQMRNLLAYETYGNANAPSHVAFPVRVQRNAAFYGVYHWVEDGDETFLARLGLDPRGALYKMYDTFSSPVTSEKKTRRFEDKSDLQSAMRAVAPGATNRLTWIWDNVDVPAMANYLAAMIITGGVDCCHKNYYAYRDSEGSGLWQFMPWDLDLTFGRDWTSSYFDDVLHPNNGLYAGWNNALIDACFSDPVFTKMYLRRIRSLMDNLLQPSTTPPDTLKFEQSIARWLALIEPDANLDLIRWSFWGRRQTMAQAAAILAGDYLPKRRQFLYRLPEIPPAQSTEPTVLFGDFEVTPASGNSRHEFIELRNTNRTAIDISGWRLAGDIEHTLASGTVLTAGGSLYLTPNLGGFRTRTNGPGPGRRLFVQGNYSGQLSARGGSVALLDGARQVQVLTLPANPTSSQQYLRISEIQFSPAPAPAGSPWTADDFEFIECVNTGPTPLDLSAVRVSGAVDFDFSTASQKPLKPGERRVIVRNAEAFRKRYGPIASIAGVYSGRLANSDERLRIEDLGEVVLDFHYKAEWTRTAAGSGYSLVAVDEHAPWTAWKNQSQWRAGLAPGGTPGISEEDYSRWLLQNFSPSELLDPSRIAVTANPDQDWLNHGGEFWLGTDPHVPSAPLPTPFATFAPDGTLALQIRVLADMPYRLEHTDSLGPGSMWKVLQDIQSPTPGQITVMDRTDPNLPHRFFRVISPIKP